ncbi:hypothetical protein EJV46_07945 [Roseococcus sp. SYP-B2431]|nr:hypothetical protein EJV46_07945 [Roseococcus sp. SYP-B2431]
MATNYADQKRANAAWRERIEALAAALHLHHDQSCTDTSRLFYLPRRPADGPAPETRILEGQLCDIFALPEAPQSETAARRRGKREKPSTGPFDFGLPPRIEFADPHTGECFDLTSWAAASARHFRIVDALRSRMPSIFVGKVAGGVRHHIICPNADAHSKPDPDLATFVCNPGDGGEAEGFVIHCRHDHCTDRDRLLFLKQMLEQRALLPDDLENPAFQPTAPPPKPVIRVHGGDLPEVVRQAEEALIRRPHRVYQRGSFLVRPGLIRLSVDDADAGSSLQIVQLEDHALAEAMTACARWQRYDARSRKWVDIDAPARIAAVLQQRRGLWRLPVLSGTLSAPTLRPDGSILDQRGYDAATGLLLAPRKTAFPSVPSRPTKDEARAALARIEQLVSTFPFVDKASRSVALSGVLTASVRRSLRTAPLHGYTAPVAGSGKSMLVDLCSIISTGRAASVISQGRTEEELEKRLGALLLGGEHVIAIDNCEAALGGEFLCSLITQEFVRCRILGKSEAPELPSNSFVTATGNNLTLLGDMTRRAILCQLDPQVERPELRTFEIDPLKEAHQHRPEFLVAALTVLRAYHVAGYPDAPDPLGSFERWSTWVRGALLWLEQADPIDTMETVRALDPKLESIAAVLSEWRTHLGDREVTVREIIDFACMPRTALGGSIYTPKIEFAHPDFREALLVVAGDKGAVNGKRLGRWIGQHEKKRVEGLRIARARILNGTQLWKLEEG